MRQNQSGKRPRGRGRKSGNNPNRTMESNGPEVKVRGTAAHIHEKYQALARDANASGDRIMAESYLQHAEHYYRVLSASQGGSHQNKEQSRDARRNSEVNGEAAPEKTAESSSDQPEVAAIDVEVAEEKPARRKARTPRSKANGAEAGGEEADATTKDAPAPRPRRRARPKKDDTEASGEVTA